MPSTKDTECASGFVTFDDHKLIVKDINVNKSNKTGQTTSSLCWHCYEKINDGEDVRIPFEIDNLKNIFYCKGYFCSFNCAMAYIIDNPMFDMNICRVNLYILARRCGIEGEIIQSPPKSLLIKFGGHMTIEDFWRNIKKRNRIVSRNFPFIHTVDEVVEMTQADESFDKEFNKTMKLYASSANIPLQNMMSVTNLKHGQRHENMIHRRLDQKSNDCLFDQVLREKVDASKVVEIKEKGKQESVQDISAELRNNIINKVVDEKSAVDAKMRRDTKVNNKKHEVKKKVYKKKKKKIQAKLKNLNAFLK